MPASVWISSGSSGPPFSFCRSWPTKTRRYWRSSVWAGPQTAVRIWRWVTTRPALRARIASSSNSFGVSLIGLPARVTECAAMSMIEIAAHDFARLRPRFAAACRSAVRRRAISSPMPNGLLT